VTARPIFTEHPELKRLLWGGEFWSDGYFVASVGRYTSENVIAEYVKNQGKKKDDYKQLFSFF
jgi:putative transposase